MTAARRLGQSLAAAFVLVAVLAFSAAPTVLAHAALVSSTPMNGEQLASAPVEVVLAFTEQVTSPQISLFDQTGTAVALAATAVANGSEVRLALPKLANGGYAASWSAVSADGHPVAGTIVFAIGADAVPPSASTIPSARTPSIGAKIAAAAARMLHYIGLLSGLGLWAFALLCWPVGLDDRVTRRIVVSAIAVGAVGGLARVLVQPGYASVALSSVMKSPSGRAWIAAAAWAAPSGIGAALTIGRASRRTNLIAVSIAAIGSFSLVALGGHGGTGDSATRGIVLTVLHMSAASCWVGGLIGGWRVLRISAEQAHSVLRRFSTVALVSVLVLAASGTTLAIRQLDSLSSIFESGYGQALMSKIVLLLVLLCIAGLSRWTLHHGELRVIDAGREWVWSWPVVLSRTLVAEIAFAGLVIGATGVLAGSSPVVNNIAQPQELQLTSEGYFASVFLAPARVGSNTLHLSILPDATSPDQLTIRFTPQDGRLAPTKTDLGSLKFGHVIADGLLIPYAGTWLVQIDARYGDFKIVTFNGTIKISP